MPNTTTGATVANGVALELQNNVTITGEALTRMTAAVKAGVTEAAGEAAPFPAPSDPGAHEERRLGTPESERGR